MTALLFVILLISIPVARGKPRPHGRSTTRYLAEHTNAVLRKKCRPTYASLSGSRRVWLRRHLLAHRAKRGTCFPWTHSWFQGAMCIHHYEGAFDADTGNGYGGGYQFLPSTLNRAAARSGGRIPFVSSTGQIAALSPFTQTLAAWLIWKQDGGSWREWGTAGKCGLA